MISKGDLSIKCWSKEHYQWLQSFGIIAFLLFIMLIPGYFIFNLMRIKKHQVYDEKKEIIRFGFLYLTYHQTYFIWDLIITSRLLVIEIIQVIEKNIFLHFFIILK